MIDPFVHRYFILPRCEIGTLRFILEGYDGLAFARTLDAGAGLVEIAFPQSRRADAEALLTALCDELSLRRVERPTNVPPI